MGKRFSSLEDGEFNQLFFDFRYTCYRLETLQRYDVSYEKEEYGRFLAGEVQGESRGIAVWIDSTVSKAVAAGKQMQRVHVVEEPLSNYLRYEFGWAYKHSVSAGEDALGEASIRRCLGDVCWYFGDHEEALQHYARGAAIARTIGDSWVEGFSTRGSGLIYQKMGETTQAISHFERALAIFQSSDNARGAGMSMLSLGLAHRSLADQPLAAEECERAVSIFRRITDRWSVAWGLLPLGEIYLDMSRPTDARQQFEEAIAIFRDFGDTRNEAAGLQLLGRVFRVQEDITRARECWDRALQIFEVVEDPRAEEVRALLDSIAD